MGLLKSQACCCTWRWTLEPWKLVQLVNWFRIKNLLSSYSSLWWRHGQPLHIKVTHYTFFTGHYTLLVHVQPPHMMAKDHTCFYSPIQPSGDMVSLCTWLSHTVHTSTGLYSLLETWSAYAHDGHTLHMLLLASLAFWRHGQPPHMMVTDRTCFYSPL